jgi:hypothetical protein
MIFFYVLVAIVGMHQYGNSLFNRCRLNSEPEEYGQRWDLVPDDTRICTKNGLGIHKCGEEYTCGNPFDYDIPLQDDYAMDNAQTFYGIPNLNNLGNSILLIN